MLLSCRHGHLRRSRAHGRGAYFFPSFSVFVDVLSFFFLPARYASTGLHSKVMLFPAMLATPFMARLTAPMARAAKNPIGSMTTYARPMNGAAAILPTDFRICLAPPACSI